MIPLLYECELEKHFASAWCVGATPATQLRRLVERGLSTAEARQRIDAQLPVAAKMARANVAFWNEGSIGSLERQVHETQTSPEQS